MKKIFFLIIFFCAGKIYAIEALLSLEELVPRSEFIVAGTLKDIHRTGVGGSGTIQVRRSIWGNFYEDEKISFVWYHGGMHCPREDYSYDDTTKEFIWLLNRKGESFYAGTNQRKRELSEEKKICEVLENNPLAIFGEDSFAINPEAKIRIVYRNVSDATKAIPKIEVRNDKIFLPDEYSIKINEKIIDKNKAVVWVKRKKNVLVAPKEQYSVEFSPRKFFSSDGRGCHSLKILLKNTLEMPPYVFHI